ncbi:hypothetical protein GCM10020218_028890 [Dactylosporangium vinaceum]
MGERLPELQHEDVGRIEFVGAVGDGDDQPGAAVVQHVPEHRAAVGRVDRHLHGPQPSARDPQGLLVDARGQQDGDPVTRTDALLAQEPGELLDPALEIAVGVPPLGDVDEVVPVRQLGRAPPEEAGQDAVRVELTHSSPRSGSCAPGSPSRAPAPPRGPR